MRIKFNDKIYRLKEIESGVDSLMELVEEPKYKDGDFVVSESGNILIFRKKDKGMIYDHALFINVSGLHIAQSVPSYSPIKRYATEEEKQILLDALEKRGKRWNAEKLCIEDIPVRKFKKGDKVRIKAGVSSKTHRNICPCFVDEMNDLIGKTMTVDRYTIDWDNYVVCNESDWRFHEDWLEPYVEDIPKCKFKKGDKVVLKRGYKKSDGLIYLDVFDLFIGRKITVAGYTDIGNVYFSDCPYIFHEDWLEPYVEELKEGDLAIFWDNVSQRHASVRIFSHLTLHRYFDISGVGWDNAIKFESKEQFEKLLKGEI
jgi:hypothetical protein